MSTGIEPGFFSDYLPVILSGCSQRIDSIRVYEFAVYESGHQSDQVAFEICGFGQPIDTEPPIVDPAGMSQWAGVVASIAEQLGVALDGIETSHELWPSEDTFEYQGRTIEQRDDRRFPLRDRRRGRRSDKGRGGARHAHAAKTRRRNGRVAWPATPTGS